MHFDGITSNQHTFQVYDLYTKIKYYKTSFAMTSEFNNKSRELLWSGGGEQHYFSQFPSQTDSEA